MDTDTVMMEKCEDPRPVSPATAAAAPGRGSPWSGLGAEPRERLRPGQHNTLTHLLQQHNGAATMVRTVISWDKGVAAWCRTENDVGQIKWFHCGVGEESSALQKVPSEDDPKVRNHGEGPY